MSSDPIIRVEHLCMRFGEVEVLKDISFNVEGGKTLCILGGSGGGKSTLLKIMIGAFKPTSGTVLIYGQDICKLDASELDRVRLKFGVMFQSGALLNSMTVAENVALPIHHHTRLGGETVETVVKLKLHQVDLLQAAERNPDQISGGMKKRAAVARALAMDPRLIFYDEPSAGLDPLATARLDQLINKLKHTMSMTSVVVTHVMESVRRIADNVIMLHQGNVILDGTLDDLVHNANPFVQQFVNGDLEGLEEAAEIKSFHKDLLM